VVFVVLSFIIVTRLVIPLASLRFMGMATIPCGEDIVDAMLAVCKVLGVELDGAGGDKVDDEVIVEEKDVVDNPKLDDIAVGKLLVAEGNKDVDKASADDTLVCELLMKLEACCDTMLEFAAEFDIMLEAYDIVESIEDKEELPVIVEDEGGGPGVEVAIEELEEKPLGIEISRAACTFEFGLTTPIEDFS
jgi:hypothetical protein